MECRFGIVDACCGSYYRCEIKCYERQRGCVVCGRGEFHPDHDEERVLGGDGHEFEEAQEDQSPASTAGEGGTSESASGASAQSATPERAQDSREALIGSGTQATKEQADTTHRSAAPNGLPPSESEVA